ncbi:MAG TPA: type II toxin-antitoxin system prevent-host-death family antitoxin [Tepidiformaceae bacterium]|nr:type II toxin-antitoxin system prevent-host-death family antitoxin [Tepidiformaceae bacterium]
MREIGAAEFKAKCLQILDHVDPEGIVITKRGKPVARLMPMPRTGSGHLIGSLKGRVRVDPDDDLFTTGIRWEAEDGLIDGEPAPAADD